jgi:hypothetical protein
VRAFDFVVDWLRRGEGSEAFQLDPSGDAPLREAKRVRRLAMRTGGPHAARHEAEQRFGMPASVLTFARDLSTPLFAAPARETARRG